MPSTTPSERLYDWVTARRTVTIFAAILVAFPLVAASRTIVTDSAGRFLLLVTLAVGVPRVYEDRSFRHERTRTAVAWVVVACALATVEFTGLYLVGVDVVGLGPDLASVGAFLITTLGAVVVLAAIRR
jgi:hypothetical protein